MNILRASFIVLLLASQSWADTLSIPTTYSVNGQVTAQNLNSNFSAVASVINGGLDNTNIDTTSGYRLFEVLSSLPAFGSQGRVVFLTSNNSLNLDTGSAWVTVSTGGLLMPSGTVFFMVSGSCPTGSTDVSATYSNKFVKINATAGTSSGADTHTHGAGSYSDPAHNHTGASGVQQNIVAGTGFAIGAADKDHNHAITQQAASSVTGTSASGDNVPANITMKACKVD